MKLRTYEESDLGDATEVTDGTYKYSFVGDLVTDNYDLFGGRDNNDVTERLRQKHVLPVDAMIDPEACCFYAYFPTKRSAVMFIKRLNNYLQEKARRSRDAEEF